MKKLTIIVLTLIVSLAAFLRFYKLDQVPPSLNWDEIAAGYNAYTIANWGADEYGNKFPIVFKSFGDDKHPVHIYLTAVVVKIFGLSDYSTRASSAFMGVLGVVAIYFLAKKLLKSEIAGLFSALFLAVSPYHLQFSRGLWEANFALDFFLAGLAAFYFGLDKKNWLLTLSFVFFGLSFFSYHSALVVVPPMVFLICLTNIKKLILSKKFFVAGLLVTIVFGALVIKEPKILGFARIKQTQFSREDVQATSIYKKTGIPLFGTAQMALGNYRKYFTYSYLFKTGDIGPRQSVKIIGEFYKIDLLLGALGLIALLLTRNWQAFIIIFSWLALSPIPGALSSSDPSANRGIFMIGPVILLSAGGASWILKIIKRKYLQVVAGVLIVVFLAYETGNYLRYYYISYSKNDAIEWQYGMKQIVDYLKRNPDYVKVYMDKIRQQPYIFFLYYFKIPLPDLLKTVKYDESESKSYNTVLSFNKYQFGGWNIIDSYPSYKILYVITPSYYGGLKYLQQFNLNELIKYPNGSDAFYIVSGDQ
jgi:4-amino-4-deoxy-L-arabinose transferase-like glycosyltransferase